MAGMEIFNTDDLSDDFLEIDEGLLMDNASEIAPKEPENKETTNISTEDDSKKDKDIVDDDEGLDLLLPPSEKSESDENIESDSSTLNPKFFSSLVQALKEGGVLDDVEEDTIESQEDFLKVIDDSVKQRELEDLNDNQKEYLEALRAGIPHEEITQHQQVQANYDSITDEALENDSEDGEVLRRNVIKVNLMAKGINEVKANKLTDKLIESGEDIAEAEEAIGELRASKKEAFEADKQTKLAQKQAQIDADKESIKSLNKIVKDTKEVIPGLKIPVNIKNKVIKGLTQPVAYTEDKRPLDIISKYLHDNPIDGRYKLAYLLTVTDNMSKMDVLENKKTKQNIYKELENSMKFKESGGKLEGQDPQFQNKFDLDNWEF